MHHIPPALPAETRDVAHIDWVAAALVVHVADNGIEVLLLRLHLVRSRQIEGTLTGKVPAGAAIRFVWVRKTGTIGVVLRKTGHVIGGSDDFVVALGEINGIKLCGRQAPTPGGKRIRSRRAAVAFEQPPPGPAPCISVCGI